MNSEVDYYAQLREHAGRIWKWGFIGGFGGARAGDALDRHRYGYQYEEKKEMDVYGSDRDILADPYPCEDYCAPKDLADSGSQSTADVYPVAPNLVQMGRP